MEFGIVQSYNDINASFDISYKVNEAIGAEMDKLFVRYKLDQYRADCYFTIYVTTSSQRTKLMTTGPVEEEDFIEYTIYFPYKAVIEAEDMVKAYLNFFFEGLTIILVNYEISKGDLDQALVNIKEEVLNNPEYQENTSQKILSYEEIQEVLKKLGGKK